MPRRQLQAHRCANDQSHATLDHYTAHNTAAAYQGSLASSSTELSSPGPGTIFPE